MKKILSTLVVIVFVVATFGAFSASAENTSITLDSGLVWQTDATSTITQDGPNGLIIPAGETIGCDYYTQEGFGTNYDSGSLEFEFQLPETAGTAQFKIGAGAVGTDNTSFYAGLVVSIITNLDPTDNVLIRGTPCFAANSPTDPMATLTLSTGTYHKMSIVFDDFTTLNFSLYIDDVRLINNQSVPAPVWGSFFTRCVIVGGDLGIDFKNMFIAGDKETYRPPFNGITVSPESATIYQDAVTQDETFTLSRSPVSGTVGVTYAGTALVLDTDFTYNDSTQEVVLKNEFLSTLDGGKVKIITIDVGDGADNPLLTITVNSNGNINLTDKFSLSGGASLADNTITMADSYSLGSYDFLPWDQKNEGAIEYDLTFNAYTEYNTVYIGWAYENIKVAFVDLEDGTMKVQLSRGSDATIWSLSDAMSLVYDQQYNVKISYRFDWDTKLLTISVYLDDVAVYENFSCDYVTTMWYGFVFSKYYVESSNITLSDFQWYADKNMVLSPIVGDINYDRTIDIQDLVGIKQGLLGINTISGIYLTVGDIDNSGYISISDLLAIKKHILGIQLIG